MGLTYKLGDKPPKKIKKAKRQPSAEDVGAAGRAKRGERFNNPKDEKRMAQTMKIATNMGKAVEEGLEVNDYGAPKGTQKHKKFSLFRKQKPKFDTNSR